MNWQEKIYAFPMPLRYFLTPPRGPGLAVVLHGYQDHAQSLLKRLGWLDGELPFQILAVNAPFPVPIWNADGFKEAYSWYFRDTSRDLVLVTPDTTASRMAELIKDLNLHEQPKVFFGFSQGGYLAPYIAKKTGAVRGIVGLGCGYTKEGYSGLAPTMVIGVHGSRDERIRVGQSQLEHEELLKLGHQGEFQVIEGLEHKVEKSVEPTIRNFIDRCFQEERP